MNHPMNKISDLMRSGRKYHIIDVIIPYTTGWLTYLEIFTTVNYILVYTKWNPHTNLGI